MTRRKDRSRVQGAEPGAAPPTPPPVPPGGMEFVIRAERAVVELRTTIAEAHGARSDLARVIKEVRAEIADKFEKHIDLTIHTGLARYEDTLRDAVIRGRDSCLRKFDQLAVSLIGSRKTAGVQEVLAAFEIGTMLEMIDERSVTDPETALLLLDMKVAPQEVNLDSLHRLRDLLRKAQGASSDSAS